MANLEPTQSSVDILAEEGDPDPSPSDVTVADNPAHAGDPVGTDAHVDDNAGASASALNDPADDNVDDMVLGEADHNVGMRVKVSLIQERELMFKVYELRESAWFDRGTGRCKGVYDDQNDVALLMVEAEEITEDPQDKDAADGPGGFLKDDLLLNMQVSKDEEYTRQQGAHFDDCG